MGRSIAALGFVAILLVALIAVWAGSSSQEVYGDPPEQLIQYDEQATAAFNDRAVARSNVNQLVIVLSVTIGITGVIVVGVGRFSDEDF